MDIRALPEWTDYQASLLIDEADETWWDKRLVAADNLIRAIREALEAT
jgi:hypothetical protein